MYVCIRVREFSDAIVYCRTFLWVKCDALPSCIRVCDRRMYVGVRWGWCMKKILDLKEMFYLALCAERILLDWWSKPSWQKEKQIAVLC